MVARLRGAGFAAFAESANTDAGLMWRVRAGPVARRDEAERMQAQIRQRLGLDGIVRPHP
jgi:cell division septation protein DedD